jgi:segregation and condensation protein A
MSHPIKLEVFEGPLDLLLYLIQKNDLDITDIPISQITSEYLVTIDLLKELNLAMAGEFLVMASTLVQIKARMLLPAQEGENGEEGPDPRAELISRLLEYQRYKEAAQFLNQKSETVKDIFYRGAPVFSKDEQTLEVSLFELLEAFKDVLAQAQEGVREIIIEEIPVERRIQEILETLRKKETLTFKELFKNDATRKEMIVTFLAVLELIRLRNVVVQQSEAFGEIWIRLKPEPALKEAQRG